MKRPTVLFGGRLRLFGSAEATAGFYLWRFSLAKLMLLGDYVLWLNVETGMGSTNPVWRLTFKKNYLVIYLFRSGLLFSRTRPMTVSYTHLTLPTKRIV